MPDPERITDATPEPIHNNTDIIEIYESTTTLACLVGLVVRHWTAVLEVVSSKPALAIGPTENKIYRLAACSIQTRQVSRPEWDCKRSLVSLVAQVGNQQTASCKHSLGVAI